jgi:hypothetical protein
MAAGGCLLLEAGRRVWVHQRCEPMNFWERSTRLSKRFFPVAPWLRERVSRLSLSRRQAAMQIRRGKPSCDQALSAVVGSIIRLISATLLAGNPPRLACSRTIASLGAMYTQ